ncbi:MAG: SDR family oxidoreductase [Clostridia bacterium]|nr:SDR family oxidoreductase [Clostridia bacterium]
MNKNGRRTVLVTGGAKGIGQSISIEMARAGYDVAVNYHNRRGMAEETKAEIEKLGRDCFLIHADMGDLKSIENMYNEVYNYFEDLDVVVNNAGVGKEVYFLDTTEEDFDFMNLVDWKGLFFSSQYAAKRMIEHNNKGVIINVSSNQSVGCWPRSTVYAPVKAAVDKFTKNCAMEMAPYGIRVVAIAPGYTNVGWPKGDIRLEAEARLPLKRFASTKEIAKGCIYLASEDADYITGFTLTIDGGALLPVVAENDFVKGVPVDNKQ